eukprot:2743396-Prymnesium_polylepis.1
MLACETPSLEGGEARMAEYPEAKRSQPLHPWHQSACILLKQHVRLRGGGGGGCQLQFRDGFQEGPALDAMADVPPPDGNVFGEYCIRRAKMNDAGCTRRAVVAAASTWAHPRGDQRAHYALRAGPRIVSIDRLSSVANFREAINLHDDAGPVWQLLSVQVLPSLASRGLGDVLVNHALTVARATAGVHSVVAVTRCQTWGDAVRRQPALTLEEHIEGGADPGL